MTTTSAANAPLSRRRITNRLSFRRLLIKRLEELAKADVDLLNATADDGMPVMCAGDDETTHLAGERIGTVIRPKTSTALSIDDPDAFYEWMTDEFPTEVVWNVEMTSDEYLAYRCWLAKQGEPVAPATPAVRPVFWKILLDTAQAGGRPHHPCTGEEVDIPGVEVGRTKTSPTFRPDKGVTHAVIERGIKDGALSLTDLVDLLDLPTPTFEDGAAS